MAVTLTSPINTATPPKRHEIAAGDVNGDGRTDLVVMTHGNSSNGNQEQAVVLLGNGQGAFQVSQTFAVGGGLITTGSGQFQWRAWRGPAATSRDSRIFESTLGGKWLEVLREIAPRIARVAVLFNPETAPRTGFVQTIEAKAAALGLEPRAAEVRDVDGIGEAIGKIGRDGDGGLLVLPDVFNTTNRRSIIDAAARHRVPAIYSLRFFAVEGGLISYGIDNLDVYRRAASYVDRILDGTRPADLPVQLPSTFECVVNLKTAGALGLAISPNLLVRANELIE